MRNLFEVIGAILIVTGTVLKAVDDILKKK